MLSILQGVFDIVFTPLALVFLIVQITLTGLLATGLSIVAFTGGIIVGATLKIAELSTNGFPYSAYQWATDMTLVLNAIPLWNTIGFIFESFILFSLFFFIVKVVKIR